MPAGRRSKILDKDYIERLERFRRAPHDGAPGGYTLPQLRSAMAPPFSLDVLKNALQGRPVWELSHAWLVAWIDKHFPVPAPRPIHDGKMAAAGPDNGQDDEEDTRTHRGSR
jgi:hypothetical protein